MCLRKEQNQCWQCLPNNHPMLITEQVFLFDYPNTHYDKATSIQT